MTINDAIKYVLSTPVYNEVKKCHAAMLATLQTEAERELKRSFSCVLVDTTNTSQTTPPATLQPEDKALWNKAVGLLTGSMYMRSGDGRALYLQIKEKIERPVTGGVESCEKTFKVIDVDALANAASGDAYAAMADISCVKNSGGGAGRRPSLTGKAGKNRARNCRC